MVVSFLSFIIIQLPAGDIVDQYANQREMGMGLPALRQVDVVRLR